MQDVEHGTGWIRRGASKVGVDWKLWKAQTHCMKWRCAVCSNWHKCQSVPEDIMRNRISTEAMKPHYSIVKLRN